MSASHPRDPAIALPDNIGELRALKYGDRICLTDEFNVFSGAICASPVLTEMARRHSYDALGYAVIKEGPGMHERGPIADFTRGALGPLQQANYLPGLGRIQVTPLDADLAPYRAAWENLFADFTREMTPVMLDDFEVRLKILEFDSVWRHEDKDMVGVLPLGKGTPSTILYAPDDAALAPVDNEFVLTSPGHPHSWPACDRPRLGLAVTKYAPAFD
jgi:hypothetical protein